MHKFDYFEQIVNVGKVEIVFRTAKGTTLRFGNEITQTTDGIFYEIAVRINTDVLKNIRILKTEVISLLPKIVDVVWWQSEDGIGDDPEEDVVFVLHRLLQFVQDKV
jgi:hypothetical protein